MLINELVISFVFDIPVFSCPFTTHREPAQLKDEKEVKPRTRQSKCCLSPIPISVDGDQSEDYFDDCITQDEFAKCLNLISKEKLQTESKDSLLAEYPLRLLSRSKAYRTLEDSPSEDLRDLKLPDDMPLTSCLGMKILHLNEDRNFVAQAKMMMSLKRYDDYCRIPFNTNKPSTCNFPKLRCREKKTYPITSLLKSSKHEANHFYTYGRRQRLDRIITLKTGLDARSRRLLRLCNRKKWIVQLEKLTEEEIESWKNRRSIPLDEESSLVEQQNLPSIETLRSTTVPTANSSTLSYKEICALLPAGTSLLKVPPKAPEPNSSRFKELAEKHKKKCQKKCAVSLPNVMRFITKRGDGFYYFKNRSIRIPFYEEFLSLPMVKKSLNNRKMKEGNNPKLNNTQKSVSVLKSLINSSIASISGYQNSSMNSPKVATVQNFAAKNATNCSEMATSQKGASNYLKEMVKNPNKERVTSSRPRRASSIDLRRTEGTEVPVIDLTGESPPSEKEKPVNKQPVPKTEKFIISQWKFTCFGCGYSRFYLSNTYEPHTVETAIHEHMDRQHSVADPESFLSRYIDRVNKCTVIEAFPGYKDSKYEL
ncbi:hypothetical protein AVEN_79951-1 [Araneus ventricosus]|uniref:Uncharacterized protein n=1 Tax=Araneus ventricosus TaxID=182803 RepID=A0A4Y2H615_ARAVE|nr:hypothetical protein AVEN_79951-1 [Araneus ventricosus]